MPDVPCESEKFDKIHRKRLRWRTALIKLHIPRTLLKEDLHHRYFAKFCEIFYNSFCIELMNGNENLKYCQGLIKINLIGNICNLIHQEEVTN